MDMTCLQRKLVFGGEEQIAAIRIMERENEVLLERQGLIDSGKLKRYTVEVTVLAKNEKDAMEQAKEMVELDEFDLDFEAGYPREIR